MIDLNCILGKNLVAVRAGNSHEKVHTAWQDESNEGFLICYEINLIFENGIVYLIQPSEIDIEDRYPGLGLAIKLKNKDETSLTSPFDQLNLPKNVLEIVESDPLGEDVVSQYVFVLAGEKQIVIRHVYPPMSLGIKVEQINA